MGTVTRASNVGQSVLNPERLFTIQEAAAVANVSKKTIQRMVRDRRLGFKVFGVRCVRIPESAVEALLR
jgi:excisionase family DNA binding protein